MANEKYEWLGLRDKIVVVTGAGGGIGRSIAINFAYAGAKLLLLDKCEADVEVTAKEVAAASNTTMQVMGCDVSDPRSVAAAASALVSTLGSCDVLVNNAGVLRPGSLDTLPLDEWKSLLSVNLTGYFICAQMFGAQMREKGKGAMVHTASIAASHPQGASGAYSVSKAGAAMLSRQLALEWGPLGIRSNVVNPGLVETPMTRAFYEVPGVREKRNACIPLRRVAQPQDIADAVLFLASERAEYVNGAEITVDGGYTQTLMIAVPRPGYH